MSRRIRVLVVDAHPMVALDVEAILQMHDDIDVVGTLGSGPEAIMVIDGLAPDVVLMDLDMPGMSGLSATEIILERRPATRVLVLSIHDSTEQIATALRYGASGYIMKDAPRDEIKSAIDVVMRGELYLCPAGSALLDERAGGRRLTGREQTVLSQLAQGRTKRDVAAALDISIRTVDTHHRNIKRKLGISSTSALARYAMEHGVLEGIAR